MSNLVIAAIPKEDDYVWKVSSEKVPHMTLLFLGDAMSNPNLTKIMDFVEHAVSMQKRGPFMMDVDHRGELGEDKADVLFFRKNWDYDQIATFRSQLLQYTPIKTAYDSASQYEEWTPHLTLGYPSAPARKDTRDYPGINWVNFDRIAVWYGDYEGSEFRLEYNYGLMEVAMGSTGELGAQFLEHFGVKGMKWGVRKDRNTPGFSERARSTHEIKLREKRPAVAARVQDTIGESQRQKTKITAKGGHDHPATEDAVRVAATRQKLKKSGFNALTNDELRDLATRANLEVQVKQLESKRPKSLGQKAVETVLSDPIGSYETGRKVHKVGRSLIR